MPLYWPQQVLLAKIEDTEGVDAEPSGAANAIQAFDVSIRPFEGTELRRNVAKPYMGADPRYLVGNHVVVEFRVDLAGSGTAGTPPPIDPILRAIGLAPTVIEEESVPVAVEYDPVSEDHEAASLYFNLSGTNHKLLGGRGTGRLRLVKTEMPHLVCTITGLWVPPAAVALPAVDFDAYQVPLETNFANSALDFHGLTAVLHECELDLAQQVVYRDLAGSNSALITARDPAGRLTIDAVALGTFNPWTRAREHTRGALAFTHGSDPGEIVEIDCPAVQIGRLAYGEADNLVQWQMPLHLHPDSGDDEIKITFK